MPTVRSILATILLAAPALAQGPGREVRETRASGPDRPAPRVVHRGATLAIAEVPRLEPAPTAQDHLDAVALSSSAGATGAVLTWPWSALEPSPGEFALDDLEKQIDFHAGGHGRALVLGIDVLDMTVRTLPQDLLDERFDSLEMKRRFASLLDAILPLLAGRVSYLSIGKEADVYLAFHPEEWTAFRLFYDDAVAHVRTAAPRVRVGTATTFRGASEAVEPLVADLNTHSDALILTYFPLGDRFAPLRPDTPRSDFPRMAELARDRPIVLLEVGYPSAPELGSSEETQAVFVRSLLEAWQEQGGRIAFLNIVALHDYTAPLCADLAERQRETATAYATYLCSLGLRRADGTPKMAWEAMLGASRQPSGR